MHAHPSPTAAARAPWQGEPDDGDAYAAEQQLQHFNLKVVVDPRRNGLEETVNFPIDVGNVIAGRYRIVEYLGSGVFSRAVQCIDLQVGPAGRLPCAPRVCNLSASASTRHPPRRPGRRDGMHQDHPEQQRLPRPELGRDQAVAGSSTQHLVPSQLARRSSRGGVKGKAPCHTARFTAPRVRVPQLLNQYDVDDTRHVLRMLDFFYYKEHLFIVCELLRDNLYELYKYISKSDWTPYFTLPRVRSIAHQCLTALAYIHSLDLIHCDLKPENILIKSLSRCIVKVCPRPESARGTRPPLAAHHRRRRRSSTGHRLWLELLHA